ncbi:MAG: enoyl-CoA hydratase / 3-hydroxyacyl-CoA dehydrogenase, partial [Actinomycetota bacterium]|nr:enoyl-CoA hydratase / 3-hydroxyacyl-CoA dehydrogenase [Actinomycetota bacterium]
MSVQVSFNGPRADLVLARPDRLNAMNVELFDELAASVDEITGRSEVRVVVVSGEGRAFSSGLDTSSFGESQGSP